MKKRVIGAVSAVVVLGAGAVVVTAQRGDASASSVRAGIETRSFPIPDGRSVDVSVEDIQADTLRLVATSDRAAYLIARSSDGMECFIIRVIDDPNGEGRGCDPEEGFAERGTQTITLIQKDGTRIGGIRSYEPVRSATGDGRRLPVSRYVVPYTLEAGRSATIELTTSDAKIEKTVP